jgi:hypothetical protein
MLDQDTLNTWVAQYEKNKTLPSKKIACTVTGTEVTMFGPNLHKRVTAFGGVRELLTGFVCRAAKKDQKQKSINVTVRARAKKPAQEVIAEMQPVVETFSTEELMSVFEE